MSIYVLNCEDKKYYIGKSENLGNRIKEHFDGNGSLIRQSWQQKMNLWIFGKRDLYSNHYPFPRVLQNPWQKALKRGKRGWQFF